MVDTTRVQIRPLKIDGALEITPVQHGDDRGVFLEWFKASTFREVVGHDLDLAQANCSVSAAGALRGVHFADVPPGQAKKKVVTADQAIIATREVLVSHGYEVVRVELVQGTRVVYYRRGNMGRGKGKGPIEKIVIRPEPDRVVFVSQPPRGLMIDINVRLGM